MPMSNEQFERQMEFILQQQAQFAVDIQELKETQRAEAALWREKHQSLNEAVTAVVGIVGRLAEAQARTEEQLSELTNRQAETDDRLNALIGVVERYFGGNGQPTRARSRASTRASKRSKPRPQKSSPKK
jgi:uncharacterized coiled-coil DUF342 family protein